MDRGPNQNGPVRLGLDRPSSGDVGWSGAATGLRVVPPDLTCQEVAVWLERKVALGNGSAEAQRQLSSAYRKLVPRWHYAMLNDAQRNAAFEAALRGVGLTGKVVLDIGAGSGLLAMMAARAGAEAVVSCEAIESIAAVAQQIVKVNGFGDQVEIIPAHSFDLDASIHLPRLADVLVTEAVDCGLVGEGIMPTLRHARRELLTSGAQIIPAGAKVVCRLLESEAVHRLNFVREAAGLDVSLFNRFSTRGYFPCRLATWSHRFLSEERELFAFDFRRDPLLPQQRTLTMEVGVEGVLHGVACWWELDLSSGVSLTSNPEGGGTHWMQAVALFESPRVVGRGERVVLRADQDDEAIYLSLERPAG